MGGAAAADALYKATVKYAIDLGPGEGVAEKGNLTPPAEGKINIGCQGPTASCSFLGVGLNEGDPLMRFLNMIPGVNATSGMHDFFQVNLGSYRDSVVLNVLGMPVAAGITAAGALYGSDGAPAFGLVVDQSMRR